MGLHLRRKTALRTRFGRPIGYFNLFDTTPFLCSFLDSFLRSVGQKTHPFHSTHMRWGAIWSSRDSRTGHGRRGGQSIGSGRNGLDVGGG